MSLEIVQPKGRLEGGGGAGGKIGEGGQHCGSREVTSIVCQFLYFWVGGLFLPAFILAASQPAVLVLLFLFLYIGPNGYLIPACYTITMFNT